MKNLFVLVSVVLCNIMLAGCAALKSPEITQSEPLSNYKYFYLTPITTEISSSNGGVYGGNNYLFGGTVSKTVSPGDVISGILLKQGMIRLPELDQSLLDQTLIVNYGESGRRNINLGYSIEVTIQFLSAKTHSMVCICTAEGQGSTEADDIRIAINRALKPLFE